MQGPKLKKFNHIGNMNMLNEFLLDYESQQKMS